MLPVLLALLAVPPLRGAPADTGSSAAVRPGLLSRPDTVPDRGLPGYARPPAPDSAAVARRIIREMKHDPRGPYRRIRWFCNDGTVHPPTPYPCEGRGGGVQHGQLSDPARRLGKMGFHVGQLLVELPFEEFLDAERNHYRLRELVVQHYLRRVDDGWVFRKARFYRGSRQVEDEEAAGRRLLRELLSDSTWVRRHYLLATELARVVPHGQQPGRLERIRDLAERVADRDSSFRSVRTKIHTDPDSGDVARVRRYLASADPQAPPARADSVRVLARELLTELRDYYRTGLRERMDPYLGEPPFDAPEWATRLRDLRDALESAAGEDGGTATALRHLARVGTELRRTAESSADGAGNLRRLDLARAVQREMVRQTARDGAGTGDGGASEPDRRILLERLRVLLRGSYGRGFLSRRALDAQLGVLDSLLAAPTLSADRYHRATSYLGRVSGWIQTSVDRAFGHTEDRYVAIEPKASEFSADLLRASVALPLERVVGRLVTDGRRAAGLSHRVGRRSGALPIRGIYPGAAVGVLEVLRSAGEVDPGSLRGDRVYLLPATVTELPPVAGLLTLSGGGALSHVQILARNLGIPTASLEGDVTEVIAEMEGDSVLYAVSPRGRVVLEPVSVLDSAARALARGSAAGGEGRLDAPPRAPDVELRQILELEGIPLSGGGNVVGPKASKLARLRRHFPDRVSPALVLPFGLYRAHLERATPPGERTLYERIRRFQARSVEAERAGRPLPEDTVRQRLERFRREILQRELDPELVRDLRERLASWTGAEGEGVFVRSDTNVEDLAGFSGAGLNLTVPHRLRFPDVLEAIKRVWASPFTWRAWNWRRRALDTPRPVHVSVVLQRSVPVDRSGVMVTTGLELGGPGAVTIAAAEGVSGAVAGEAAETLAVEPGGRVRLLTPYRAAFRKELVYEGAGGTRFVPTSGAARVLTDARARRLAALADTLRRTLPPARDRTGRRLPWDVEYGFQGEKLWLFQVRPLAGGGTDRTARQLARLDAGSETRGSARVDLDRPPGEPHRNQEGEP